MSQCEFLNDLWRDLAGLPPKRLGDDKGAYHLYGDAFILQRKISEWNEEFERDLRKEFPSMELNYIISLMKNRLLMGSFRYGLMKEQDYGRFNLVKLIKIKNELYINTRDLEALVDASNLCLLAYTHAKRLSYKPFKCAYPGERNNIIEYAITAFEQTYNPWLMVLLAAVFVTDFIIELNNGAILIAQDDKNHAEERV